MATTIQISRDLQQELNKMKLFDRETYEEVIWGVIEDSKELSQETKNGIIEARKQFAKGEFITLSDLEKEYGIK